jgi:RNA polymerase sigma factor (sigma-70 family)
MFAATNLDVGALYGSFAPRLERIVRLDVGAPDPVVEDACQFAWSRLIDSGTRIRRDDAVLSWLATTAVREARRLTKRNARELPLDGALEPVAASPGPHELAEYRERLGLLEWLPERQQRLLWLHALGLSYAEMASSTGCSRRTVERQLLRAKRRVRALAADGQCTLISA